jgi:hypothetical protein
VVLVLVLDNVSSVLVPQVAVLVLVEVDVSYGSIPHVAVLVLDAFPVV